MPDDQRGETKSNGPRHAGISNQTVPASTLCLPSALRGTSPAKWDIMKIRISDSLRQAGKVGKIALLWLIGIPLPIAIIFVYLAGCR
jgi:hypothetical protein